MSDGIPSSVEKTVINSQTAIKGEVSFAGPAVICGRIEGQIRAQDDLEVSSEGSVEGDITGAVVDIQGTVKGNVTASRTARLGPNAKLIGELRAANLAISEGAIFVGKVCVGEVPATPKPEVKHVTAHQPTVRPVDPAAALQSRLASLQESGVQSETNVTPINPVRIVAGAVNELKRASINVTAGH